MARKFTRRIATNSTMMAAAVFDCHSLAGSLAKEKGKPKFDPTVVDSIVQPSSLVLGYVYRPYTAHSFVAGVRYLW